MKNHKRFKQIPSLLSPFQPNRPFYLFISFSNSPASHRPYSPRPGPKLAQPIPSRGAANRQPSSLSSPSLPAADNPGPPVSPVPNLQSLLCFAQPRPAVFPLAPSHLATSISFFKEKWNVGFHSPFNPPLVSPSITTPIKASP